MKDSPKGSYTVKCLGEQDASRVANFHGIIRDIDVLGCTDKPEWNRDTEGLHIRTAFHSDNPIVFRIRID